MDLQLAKELRQFGGVGANGWRPGACPISGCSPDLCAAATGVGEVCPLPGRLRAGHGGVSGTSIQCTPRCRKSNITL